MKAILNQLSASCKTFSLALKTHSQSTNSNIWFNNLMQHFYEKFLIEQTQTLKQKLNLKDLNANLTKYFQQYYLFIQFLSYIFNNLFHLNNNSQDAASSNDDAENIKLKLFTKFDGGKIEHSAVYFCKILNHLLDSYLNLTQINDTADTLMENQEQQQQNLQNYAQTFLITFIDVILKLTQNVNQNTGEIDFILIELANIVYKIFELNFNLKTLIKNQTTNELEIKLILKYFNQTFINSKKFNDHFEHLFNELNSLLQGSPYDYNFSKKLNDYEPIVYSLFRYSSLKTQLRHKIVNTWNSTFGKCFNEPLCYSKRLEKCFHELNNDSSIILLNTTATLTHNTEKDKKLAISLPGFHNCENIMVNTQANLAAVSPPITVERVIKSDQSNKENSPLICSNDTSLSASSSVPIVQLIQSNKKKDLELILTDDDTDDGFENNKIQKSPSTNAKLANFVFSPANSFNRKSFHQNDQKLSPLTPSNSQQLALSNSATKRKLDLNNLIDQMPDKDFIKINNENQTVNVLSASTSTVISGNNSPFQFKAPLTEHQKEVKKAKSFMPSEIHNVCIELTSSLVDPNQSMSCTLDFDESNPPPLNKQVIEVVVPKDVDIIEDTLPETEKEVVELNGDNEDESIANDWSRKSKRVKIEASPKDISKIQFYSKIKPNKHIDLITLSGDVNKIEDEVNLESEVDKNNKIEISEEDENEDDENDDSIDKSQRRSQRIKSKGCKSMQVLIKKLEDTEELSHLSTAAVNPLSNEEVEVVKQVVNEEHQHKEVQQEEKLSELPTIITRNTRTRARNSKRPNTISVLQSDVEKAKEQIVKSHQEVSTPMYDPKPDIQELTKQEEEKINEVPSNSMTVTGLEEEKSTETTEAAVKLPKKRGRRANTITILPSAVKEAQELISKNEEMSTISNSQESEASAVDDTESKTMKRGRRSSSRRQSVDSVSTENEEISNSQNTLMKPIADKQSRISKLKGKSTTISSSGLLSPSNKQKKQFKLKLNSVIDKLKNNHKPTEENAGETENTAFFEDVCKISTNEKRRSTRISSKRNSISNEDRYEKDVKIDDPFESSSQIETITEVEKISENENKSSVESEMAHEATVETVEEKEKMEIEEKEVVPVTTRLLETIPEIVTDNSQAKETAIVASESQKEEDNAKTIDDSNNIQFTKIVAPPPTPTASILKKRRSVNYNLNDLNPQSESSTPPKVN